MNSRDDEVTPQPTRRPGRRRDASRDDAILEATRELLVERGYVGMTMDAVAERAGAGKATVYRRWTSKVQLTLDAIACHLPVTIEDLPDSGSLRGDLMCLQRAILRPDTGDLMAGLTDLMREKPEVAMAFQREFIALRTGLIVDILERAEQRGEVPVGRDLEMIATVGLAMFTYQKMVAGKQIDTEFITRLIDSILVPLATGGMGED